MAITASALLKHCFSPVARPRFVARPDSARFLATCEISARPHWNNTGVNLINGHRYYFEVPAGQIWNDWFVACGPEGYFSPLLVIFGWLRRCACAPWFCLIGTVDKESRNRFAIGRGDIEYTASLSGRLFCYANDIYDMYWNNTGNVQVNIFEISSRPD